jgi:phage I-like protein
MGAATKLTRRAHVTLAIDAGSEPPTEFRIFARGVNETTKGNFVFDDAAAESVMAEYQAHAIDLMIDYDHASLAPVALDPALASRAAGWFNLEVRAGELWAVNVRWTEPAANALRAKEWRFMSPAFEVDTKTNRVTSLLNVAITNLPATRRLTPLVAANALETLSMSPELIKKALEAIKNGDADAAMALLEEMIAGGGEPDADEAPAAEPPAEMADAPAVDPEEDKKDEVAAAVAASARLVRLTGKTNLVEAIDEAEVWRQSHVKLEGEIAKLAKEKAAIELGQRKENAIKLTKLGAETPATTGLAKGKLCKRLLDEPLDEQNARVAALLAAKGGNLPKSSTLTPPASAEVDEFQTPHGTIKLSADEMKMCAAKKIDPAKYAATRAGIKARGNANGIGV